VVAVVAQQEWFLIVRRLKLVQMAAEEEVLPKGAKEYHPVRPIGDRAMTTEDDRLDQ